MPLALPSDVHLLVFFVGALHIDSLWHGIVTSHAVIIIGLLMNVNNNRNLYSTNFIANTKTILTFRSCKHHRQCACIAPSTCHATVQASDG
jgi:hypothetical protein